jgi:predicted Zn-dependent protease with MMP-like domain
MVHFTHPPTLDDIEAIARAELDALPDEFRRHLGDIVFRVVEFPDDETLTELGCESPFELMGLYHGVDMASKSVSDPQPTIDCIDLYRRPLLDYWCETEEDFTHLIRHVLIHEIGHHFGLSDDDMHAIEDGLR